MKIKKHVLAIITLALVLVAATGVEYLFLRIAPYHEAQTIGSGVSTFAELADRFSHLAQTKGAAYAYEVLRRAQLPPGTDVHLLGHAVGNVLYQQQGPDGITLCTEEFRNACSHAIAIGILTQYGIGNSARAMIDTACSKAPGGPGAYGMCYHGLGHGIFAYFEYDLPKTIAFCKTLGTPEHGYQQYVQCVGGAIMELVGGGGHDHDFWLAAQHNYLSNDPLSPCFSSIIPGDVRDMCLVYITPLLWQHAGIDPANPDPALFPKAFSYCEQISVMEKDLRQSCFGSFGREFISLAANRDARSITKVDDAHYIFTTQLCNGASAEDGKNFCVQGALDSIFWGGENDPHAAFRFCSLVNDPTLSNACYERLAWDISLFITDSQERTALCAEVPEAFRTTCIAKNTALL